MTTFLQDIRYAARGLRRAPGFTLVAVLTLALGIGANAAMFGIVDALLFRPPSGIADPAGVVRVQLQLPPRPNEPVAELSSALSYPDYTNLRDNAKGFSGVAAFAPTTVSVGEGENARNQSALLVTGDYFRLLGVRAARGRLILPEDDREGAPNPVVVLSYDFWRRAFPGDSASGSLGKPITIADRSFTIIGVAPKHFVGTDLGAPALWLPLGAAPLFGYDARMTRSRFVSWLSVVARLAPGVTRDQARASAQAATLAARDDAGELPPPGALGGPMAGEVRVQLGGPPGPGERAGRAPPPPSVRLSGLAGGRTASIEQPFLRGRSMPISLWFLAITAAVLLIACANIANLMLARTTNRAQEIAVRLSLGATRRRLTRQLMTESLMVAVLGGAAGLWLAVFAVDLLPRVVPLPPLPPFLDTRVLAFTALLVLGTTVAFGLAPALRATRPDLRSALGGGGLIGATRSVGRRALVVVQLAASLVLLIGAGLFIRSLRNVRAIDVGFDAERLLVASIDAGDRMSREQREEFWRRALERTRAMPGVRSAAVGMAPPFEMNIMILVETPGFPSPDGRPRGAQLDFAGVGYFSTLGIPIRQGRAFTEDDRAGGAPVAIVNETMARRIWGSQSPIGKCVRAEMMAPTAPCSEVVGVARDAKFADITSDAQPFIYRPLAQRSRQAPPMTVMYVRSSGDPAALAGPLRRELEGLDPAVRFAEVRPVANLLAPQIQPWRVGTMIFTLFGALGLVLAAVGLYGVLSFLVAQRTREIGVRIALGAPAGSVLSLVLGQGARLIAIGVVVGMIVGALATQLFASMMFGVSPLDPFVYVATALVLATIGMLAVYVPARRATQVDAMVALRSD
ncbi:MAG TPA: ABC transporter permease [Gemmatimonadaceae bacterium]|nr:ABC transporter permease [Gemmatimonadaceae bacterium]